jgi:hypothetical protein
MIATATEAEIETGRDMIEMIGGTVKTDTEMIEMTRGVETAGRLTGTGEDPERDPLIESETDSQVAERIEIWTEIETRIDHLDDTLKTVGLMIDPAPSDSAHHPRTDASLETEEDTRVALLQTIVEIATCHARQCVETVRGLLLLGVGKKIARNPQLSRLRMGIGVHQRKRNQVLVFGYKVRDGKLGIPSEFRRSTKNGNSGEGMTKE